jgi:hypothetical protein
LPHLDFLTWQGKIGRAPDWIIETPKKQKGGQVMSQSFRPVKEIWNVHSSCFVEHEELTILLHDLAARVGTASDEHEYGDNKAIWLEDGTKVLEYIEADERFSAASFKDSLEEQGVVINKNDLTSLIDNIRTLAKQWRSSLGEHGELVFYVDAC